MMQVEEPSVLIADDNDAWREAVDDVLRREGLRTVQARCGEEAVELVRAEHLDLALIDFHMPRLDGLATVRAIRRVEPKLPAILMTAHPQDLPPAEVQRLRISRVLVKSGDRHGLVTVVVRTMRRRW